MKAKENKIPVTIRLRPNVLSKIEAVSRHTYRNRNLVIEKGIDLAIKEIRREFPRSIPTN